MTKRWKSRGGGVRAHLVPRRASVSILAGHHHSQSHFDALAFVTLIQQQGLYALGSLYSNRLLF